MSGKLTEPIGPSLREKLEGPAAIREVINAARGILEWADGAALSLHAEFGIDEYEEDDEITALRNALDRLDEIRTGR